MTSLDHVIYFHRPFDVTKWMAVENVVSVASGGRALIEMKYWNEDGQLVATVLQEVSLTLPPHTKGMCMYGEGRMSEEERKRRGRGRGWKRETGAIESDRYCAGGEFIITADIC